MSLLRSFCMNSFKPLFNAGCLQQLTLLHFASFWGHLFHTDKRRGLPYRILLIFGELNHLLPELRKHFTLLLPHSQTRHSLFFRGSWKAAYKHFQWGLSAKHQYVIKQEINLIIISDWDTVARVLSTIDPFLLFLLPCWYQRANIREILLVLQYVVVGFRIPQKNFKLGWMKLL